MIKNEKTINLIAAILLIVGFLFGFIQIASADELQDQIDAANSQIEQLNKQIAEYQSQLKQVNADKKTLKSAINTLDLQMTKVQTQINATENQIKVTELQIRQMGGQIKTTQSAIETYKDGIAESLRYVNSQDEQPLVLQLAASGGLSELWQKVESDIRLQDALHKRTEDLKKTKNNLVTKQNTAQQKKDLLAQQKQDLADQKQDLNSAKKAKNRLLAETNNKESTYQNLLTQAKKQLNSFLAFTRSAGGARLLSKQTICDSWGCYYNQRDSTWGTKALNNTEYTLADAGCLITSMAMIMTHYGYRTITPASINANPDNFASYYPAFLLKSITVNGITATRVTTQIDSSLANGTPVIVGMNVNSGTHFVVLVSGKNGKYLMRDPYISGGKDISFNDHYKVSSIYSIARVDVSE